MSEDLFDHGSRQTPDSAQEPEPTPPPVMAPPTEPVPPLDPKSMIVDAQGRLLTIAKCAGCGYNLRGLPHDGDCPECHMSIELTFCGNLYLADTEWLARVSRGLLVLIIAIFAAFGVGFAAGLTAPIPVASTTGKVTDALLLGIPWVLLKGIAICQAWGYLVITTPEPAAPESNRATRLRRVARVALLSAILLGIVSFSTSVVFMSLFDPSAFQSNELQLTSRVFGLGGTLLRLVGLYALCTYATTIAMRIPSPSVARQTKVVMWGLIVGGAIGAVSTISRLFIDYSPMRGALGMSLTLAALVFGIWGIVLLFRYRNSLQRAIAQAKRVQMGTGQK